MHCVIGTFAQCHFLCYSRVIRCNIWWISAGIYKDCKCKCLWPLQLTPGTKSIHSLVGVDIVTFILTIMTAFAVDGSVVPASVGSWRTKTQFSVKSFPPGITTKTRHAKQFNRVAIALGWCPMAMAPALGIMRKQVWWQMQLPLTAVTTASWIRRRSRDALQSYFNDPEVMWKTCECRTMCR